MDQTQNKRKREYVMKEEMTTEELVIQELLAKLMEITQLPTQQGNFMHLNIP
jgi:hypothetical protein